MIAVTPHTRRGCSRLATVVFVLMLGWMVAACGGSAAGSSSASSANDSAPGPVQVLYAGSLVRLMERRVGPAFNKATGITFSGYGGGSTQLANEIKGRVRTGDVFISASPQVDDMLKGPANGAWVSWVADFATAPLVVGFEPSSRFAAALNTASWERVVTRSGFLVGRTDPVLDPKGRLTVEAIQQAAQGTHDPALLALEERHDTVFPEETLLGRLEAGQLDAGFFYANEAKEAGLATAALTPVSLSATYTLTVLEHAPHRAAAVSFVSYLLGPLGRRLLAADGLHIATPPHVTGTGVPMTLDSVLGR